MLTSPIIYAYRCSGGGDVSFRGDADGVLRFVTGARDESQRPPV